MKEILMLSGKGGAGKTSITACFAQLSQQGILVDCDVDASDLHLLLQPETTETHEFFAGFLPEINDAICSHCRQCYDVCRFHAIDFVGDQPKVIADSCEGCGICADHCPTQAIHLESRLCGQWMRSETTHGPMYHAALFPGAENSGKLVAEIRRATKKEAETGHYDLILSDGPPGIGCPVISASSGVDYAVIVTEPTITGLHDMKRLAQVLAQFEIPFGLIINKADVNWQLTADLKNWCQAHHVDLLGEIPFDPQFSHQLRAGKTILEAPHSGSADLIKTIWKKLISTIK